MNKKQAGIIVTLLALIVCAGILAARVNGPLEVTNDSYNQGSSVFNWGKDNASKNDSFVSARLDRDNGDQTTLSALRTIMDDKNLAEANKNEATKKYNSKVAQMDNESRIEQTLKLSGFEDVICLISDDNTKATVVIKSKEEPTSQQRKKINDVVASVAKIKVVEIQTRQ